jgi:amidase
MSVTFKPPTDAELIEIAEELGIYYTDADIAVYKRFIGRILDDIEWVARGTTPRFAPHDIDYSDRKFGHKPTSENNPHNAWITKCRVEGAKNGLLAGKTVGLKDNISLAGVEMTCGSRMLNGYRPGIDATVVTRLLESGAEITGKLNMESFSFSTSSDSSDYGKVTNPWDQNYIAGGSSSGSGVAPAIDEVDIAVGTDQGGSIRVPAACCGIVGLDPTTGLIPYTGIFPLDNTMDHVGPMAKTVGETATALEVMAGSDGLDSRQPPSLDTDTYTEGLVEDVTDIEIGVLAEGFEHDESEQVVSHAVRDAIGIFEELGSTIRTVSVPLHNKASKFAFIIWGYGGLQIYKQSGQGSLYKDWYNTEVMEMFKKSKSTSMNELGDTEKAILLAMGYFDQEYPDPIYGSSQNLSLKLQQRYNEIFQDVDVIALPTIPMKPFEMAGTNDRVDRLLRESHLTKNTSPFSTTNHPSISVPVGTIDGLPVGLQLVADHFEEKKLIRVSHTLEQNIDWKGRTYTT